FHVTGVQTCALPIYQTFEKQTTNINPPSPFDTNALGVLDHIYTNPFEPWTFHLISLLPSQPIVSGFPPVFTPSGSTIGNLQRRRKQFQPWLETREHSIKRRERADHKGWRSM